MNIIVLSFDAPVSTWPGLVVRGPNGNVLNSQSVNTNPNQLLVDPQGQWFDNFTIDFPSFNAKDPRCPKLLGAGGGGLCVVLTIPDRDYPIIFGGFSGSISWGNQEEPYLNPGGRPNPYVGINFPVGKFLRWEVAAEYGRPGLRFDVPTGIRPTDEDQLRNELRRIRGNRYTLTTGPAYTFEQHTWKVDVFTRFGLGLYDFGDQNLAITPPNSDPISATEFGGPAGSLTYAFGGRFRYPIDKNLDVFGEAHLQGAFRTALTVRQKAAGLAYDVNNDQYNPEALQSLPFQNLQIRERNVAIAIGLAWRLP